MKKFLSIILASLVCLSVIGCAANQNKGDENITICGNLVDSFSSVGDIKYFYMGVSERMIDEGFLLIQKYDYRGRRFKREFVRNGIEYEVLVDINVSPQLNEYAVLTNIPYVSFSMKRTRKLFISNKDIEYGNSQCLFFGSIVGYIVEKAANNSRVFIRE